MWVSFSMGNKRSAAYERVGRTARVTLSWGEAKEGVLKAWGGGKDLNYGRQRSSGKSGALARIGTDAFHAVFILLAIKWPVPLCNRHMLGLQLPASHASHYLLHSRALGEYNTDIYCCLLSVTGELIGMLMRLA